MSSSFPPSRMRARDDHGAVAAFVVLVLVGLLALVGLVVDGGTAFSAHQALQVEAEQAARAGAGQLSVDALRTDQIRIDGPAAVEAAGWYMSSAGHPGAAIVSGGVVTVHIQYRIPTSILSLIGIDWIHVSAQASAVDVGGVTRGTP